MKKIVLILSFISLLYADSTVIDKFLELEWEDTQYSKKNKIHWNDAVQYCNDLTIDNKSDWRLPSKGELLSIYSIKSKFKNLNWRLHWSSTTLANDSNMAYTVFHKKDKYNKNRFKVGKKDYAKLYVKCVRLGVSSSNLMYENALKKIKKEDNIEKYKWFIKSYPYIPQAKLAQEEIYKVAFRTAQKENTVEKYKQFIKSYPNTYQAIQAQEEIYKVAFEIVQKKNSIKEYENFIKIYPNAIQVKEAREKIYVLAYKIIQYEENIAGYEWFIKKYPNAPQVKEAIAKIHELAYEKAEDIDTISAYNTFIIAYPTASQVVQANEEAYKLEKKKYTDVGMLGFFGKEEKLEKKARKLLIKAKQIERQGNSYSSNTKAGYVIVTNRMYDLLQSEFDDSDATLRHLESQEFKDFVSTFKNVMSSISRKLGNIEKYSSEILETSKQGFSDAKADRKMAAYKQEQHTKWEKHMHFRDKGYQ